MPESITAARVPSSWKPLPTEDLGFLLLSLLLQFALAPFFGHYYDIRIFMATGYLVASGQNPYVSQNLTAVFHNASFQGMTSVGYPPPWPLVLGLLYRTVYPAIPNLLAYNLVIKIPLIAANIGLAYLVAGTVRKLGGTAEAARKAKIFLLLGPFLLYFSAAWGQFDSIVALLAIYALLLLHDRKSGGAAALLALAVSFKPTAVPLLPVALAYPKGASPRQRIRFFCAVLVGFLLFSVAPFILLQWSPTPILRHWNAHFAVGGGMSVMTFLELLRGSYQLPGLWWLLGLAWMPALGASLLALRAGVHGLNELLQRSTGLILVFFLTRSWLSEPNIILVLPLVLILTSIGELNTRALAAVWILPLVFTIFNASLPQILFPAFPEAMARVLNLAEEYRAVRLVARCAVVVPWQIAGWWIVAKCLKRSPVPPSSAAIV